MHWFAFLLNFELTIWCVDLLNDRFIDSYNWIYWSLFHSFDNKNIYLSNFTNLIKSISIIKKFLNKNKNLNSNLLFHIFNLFLFEKLFHFFAFGAIFYIKLSNYCEARFFIHCVFEILLFETFTNILCSFKRSMFHSFKQQNCFILYQETIGET